MIICGESKVGWLELLSYIEMKICYVFSLCWWKFYIVIIVVSVIIKIKM